MFPEAGGAGGGAAWRGGGAKGDGRVGKETLILIARGERAMEAGLRKK